MRLSQSNHLWSFKKYTPDARVVYVNMGLGNFPMFLKLINFDLIVFDWSFVGSRAERKRFVKTLRKIEHLKEVKGVKIALPQDEFTSMDLLNYFINDFKVNHVFSVAPESEWDKIYPEVDRKHTQFSRILTGYLDEKVIERWKEQWFEENRPIDIGYRTVSTAIWGRFNLMKAIIAEVFLNKSKEQNIKVDIKVGAQNFFLGEKWLEFLASCRFTLGIEGGSRILDWDGVISKRVYNYLKLHPNATLDELATVCVPIENEGEVEVTAISPRHLEACLTGTVQILVEGDYNGILKPYVHYIPLRSDFSNLNEVFEQIKDESRRRLLAYNAYRDIVLSGKYTYRSLISNITTQSKVPLRTTVKHSVKTELCLFLAEVSLWINISAVWFLSELRKIRNFIINSTIIGK